ncbi:hypothetical protein WJX81_004950 [Elliptochloris bilobata]|uniref:TNase-like domain-containing protein n=1 Tax=Elliptochloris bilobata TaxID=381761 RepID=A0AAW1SK87_9CHLO
MTIQGRKVRLFAVDAPELLQTCTDKRGRSYDCGEAAAAALRTLVRGTSLSCLVVRHDRYRRAVARCTRPATLFQRAVDLSEWLLERGHALVYRQYAGRYLGEYERLEAAARKAGRGIWAGSFVPPWVWRKDLGWP